MLAEEIDKAWKERARDALFYPRFTFAGGALVLGGGVAIVSAEPLCKSSASEAQAREARAMALLSATYPRRIGASTMAHMRRALEKQDRGGALLASVHLALMGLPALERGSEQVRRLFAADRLMSAGVTPDVIFKALDLDGAPLRELVRRYNPDQPRVPAGSGPASGQWTADLDTSGTALAIGTNIGVQGEQSGQDAAAGGNTDSEMRGRAKISVALHQPTQSTQVISDASSDSIKPGQQYAAQIIPRDFTSGNSRIDQTTDKLMSILALVADWVPDGVGSLYGIAMHVAFGTAVRALNLPGIGFDGVEQSFSLGDIAN